MALFKSFSWNSTFGLHQHWIFQWSFSSSLKLAYSGGMGSTTGWVVVFAQMTAKWPYTLQWDAPFTLKIATSHGGIWTPSNAWFPGPTHNGTRLQLQQPLAIPGKNHKVQNVDIAVRFKISFDDKLHEVCVTSDFMSVSQWQWCNTAELLVNFQVLKGNVVMHLRWGEKFLWRTPVHIKLPWESASERIWSMFAQVVVIKVFLRVWDCAFTMSVAEIDSYCWNCHSYCNAACTCTLCSNALMTVAMALSLPCVSMLQCYCWMLLQHIVCLSYC